jgi:hypothetical protein
MGRKLTLQLEDGTRFFFNVPFGNKLIHADFLYIGAKIVKTVFSIPLNAGLT